MVLEIEQEMYTMGALVQFLSPVGLKNVPTYVLFRRLLFLHMKNSWRL